MQSRRAFCSRRRSLRAERNNRQVSHWLVSGWLSGSARFVGFAVIAVALIVGLPQSSASLPPVQESEAPAPVVAAPAPLQEVREDHQDQAAEPEVSPEVRKVEAFLKRNNVNEALRERLAESIVESAKEYGLNPRLLASIVVVESRGNPFAISGKTAVGVMQIHIPTWGNTADREDINLFKIEDNVNFGARILKDYVRRFGVWEGVKRYNGLVPGDPVWEESAQVYLTKVQDVYDGDKLKSVPTSPAAAAPQAVSN